MSPVSRLIGAALLPLLLLVLVAGGLPALAQSINATTNDGPIEITAQESLEWLSNEQLYVARGQAQATRGDIEINADVLSAKYRETTAGESEIYRIEAEGNVVIETPDERVTGDLGVYDIDTQLLTLTGKDLKLTTPQETLIADDSLEYNRLTGRAMAKGNATIWNERDRVSADTLIADLVETQTGDLELSRVFGDGNVVIITAQETIRGDEGMYDLKAERATVNGNVRITRGDNQLNGAVAEVDLATGISRLLAGENGTVRATGLLSKEDAGGQ